MIASTRFPFTKCGLLNKCLNIPIITLTSPMLSRVSYGLPFFDKVDGIFQSYFNCTLCTLDTLLKKPT